jgi:hypothetical protein
MWSKGGVPGSVAVSGRVVETVFVFDRHAATDLSVAYAILVPERAARPIAAPGPAGAAPAAGQEGRLAHDQHEKQHEDQDEDHQGQDQQQRNPGQDRGRRAGARRRRRPPAGAGQFELDLGFGVDLARWLTDQGALTRTGKTR